MNDVFWAFVEASGLDASEVITLSTLVEMEIEVNKKRLADVPEGYPDIAEIWRKDIAKWEAINAKFGY